MVLGPELMQDYTILCRCRQKMAWGPFRFGDNGHSCHVDRAVPLTLNIIGLRLWKATLPTRSFDFYQLLPISHRPVALPAFVWLATGYKIEDTDWVSRNTTIIHKPNNRLDHSCEPKRLFWPISAHYLSRVRNAHMACGFARRRLDFHAGLLTGFLWSRSRNLARSTPSSGCCIGGGRCASQGNDVSLTLAVDRDGHGVLRVEVSATAEPLTQTARGLRL